MTLAEVRVLSPDDVLNEILVILSWDVSTRNGNWCFDVDHVWKEIPKLCLELLHELEYNLDDCEYALYCGHLVALHGAKRVVSAPVLDRGKALLLTKKGKTS